MYERVEIMAGVDWSQFRSDAQRTSVVEGGGPSEEPTEQWRENVSYPKPSVTFDGTVLFPPIEDSGVHAIDIESGDLEWRYEPDSEVTTVVADTEIERFVTVTESGQVDVLSPDGARRRSSNTGAKVRRAKNTLVVDGSLVVYEFGAIRLDIQTGEVEAWNWDWRANAIAYDDGDLYVLAPGTVVCVDATGPFDQFEWRESISRPELEKSDPEYEPEWVGSEHIAVCDQTLYVDVDTSLIALDRTTGTERWRTGAAAQFPPAITETDVYQRSNEGIVALDAKTAKRQWRFEPEGGPPTAPVIGGDTLYVGEYVTEEARLYALDRMTGEVLWTYDGLESLYTLMVTDDGLLTVCGDELVKLSCR